MPIRMVINPARMASFQAPPMPVFLKRVNIVSDFRRLTLALQPMTMDWLAENVIGAIPKKEELKEQAEPVMKQQGIKKQEKETLG